MEFVIKDRLNKVNKTNCYYLVVHYMHGDADAYSTEEFVFRNTNLTELEMYITYLQKVINLDDEQQDKIFAEVFYNEEISIDFEFEEDYEELRVGDCTCDRMRRACITNFILTYFDKEGKEFTVEIKE